MKDETYPFEIGVAELKRWLDDGKKPAIIDVREASEYEICRIAGSLHIPMGTIPDSLDRLPKDGPLVVTCHHGGRSARVVSWLRQQGIDRAINLAGGGGPCGAAGHPGHGRY
ncbi:MAG: sulfurtransferase [Alphaproteobacteria bacterium]|nr:sulfurtransferase [Alphaproteobacteria bacterium]